jgi:hypothetical protein
MLNANAEAKPLAPKFIVAGVVNPKVSWRFNMKFKARHFYTHKRMLDMVVQVIYIFQSDHKDVLKVRWFNKRGLNIGLEETIEINEKELHNWHEWERI